MQPSYMDDCGMSWLMIADPFHVIPSTEDSQHNQQLIIIFIDIALHTRFIVSLFTIPQPC